MCDTKETILETPKPWLQLSKISAESCKLCIILLMLYTYINFTLKIDCENMFHWPNIVKSMSLSINIYFDHSRRSPYTVSVCVCDTPLFNELQLVYNISKHKQSVQMFQDFCNNYNLYYYNNGLAELSIGIPVQIYR